MPSASRKPKQAPVTAPAAAPEPVAPVEPVVAAPPPKPSKKKPAKAPAPAPALAPEPAPEPEYTPTFPNIVILKQTEHNYIVKHNIDPRSKQVVVNTHRFRFISEVLQYIYRI